ncbi:MAG: site-specific DNA-methyltransferase, partial [Candidatus Poseidoniaceae archaeon]|nr:site-specific DNA-methyltransferase [Candidatus Poseidoniaceae archaeon]
MTGDNNHTALIPSEEIAKEAENRVSAKAARKGEPLLHMTDDMKRLSTPWSISMIRAEQIESFDLPAGIILDAAVGSGTQLIALANELKRPALGVELDGNIAVLCAANMHSASNAEEIHRTLNRVIIGDSSDAEGAITTYWNSLMKSGIRAHPPVAMLHLDPARPRDAQNHHVDEMKPSLMNVLKSWNEYLQTGPRGPAVLLDLSPRLGEEQQGMIEAMVETVFPGAPKTWEWLSQGGGRVDRLSLWIGAISSKDEGRCIRMGTKNIIAKIEGKKKKSKVETLSKPPPFGAYISIIDSALIQSGLQEKWLSKVVKEGTGHSWLRIDGRRPLLIHTDPLINDDDINGFVVSTGEIVQHRLTAPELDNLEQISNAATRNNIGKITLRCSLNPEIQPTLQRRLDKELRNIDGAKSFMIDVD